MATRRTFLTVMGGGVILAAAGVGYKVTRTPQSALAPWDAAGGYEEPRRRALSYALLAPNPHNRQPWMVDLSTPDQITIWRDKTRDLPETDPFDRQLTIGMGCFLELMRIAAAETGHQVTFDLFPGGDTGPVALARFSTGAAADPLFAHVLARRSCKAPFEARPVPAAPALSALADLVLDPAVVADIRKITFDAWMIEATTHRTMKESTELFRLGHKEIDANPDGLSFSGPFFETMILFGMMSREGALDPTSFEFAEGMKIYEEMLAATPAYCGDPNGRQQPRGPD